MEALRREFVYFSYYFMVQLEQIFPYWILGMLLGSAVSVFMKDHIHNAFRSMQGKRLGILGIVCASALVSLLPFVCTGRFRLLPLFPEAVSRTIGWRRL